MEAAKLLLADTALSVTNVCLEVGYSSLGTFTRRFTEFVGLSPRAFRRLARCPAPRSVREASATPIEISRDHPEEHTDIQLCPPAVTAPFWWRYRSC
jgi:AraC-like DNA-binding protein